MFLDTLLCILVQSLYFSMSGTLTLFSFNLSFHLLYDDVLIPVFFLYVRRLVERVVSTSLGLCCDWINRPEVELIAKVYKPVVLR